MAVVRRRAHSRRRHRPHALQRGRPRHRWPRNGRGAVEAGKRIRVFADETRPYLQGARLTAWELHRDGIDVTLVCDNMAGYLMQHKEITWAVVGADHIARNGDTANKIIS